MNINFQNYTFCLFNVLICTHISYYSDYSDPEFSCPRPCWSSCHKKYDTQMEQIYLTSVYLSI